MQKLSLHSHEELNSFTKYSPNQISAIIEMEDLMNISELLKIKDISLLIAKERENNNLVIATPHHSPLGVYRIPCETHRGGDEGAGFLVNHIAQNLNCSSIIASNYFIDSNKYLDSDYSKKIEKWNPKTLIEIHGHGSKNAFYDIEISAGSVAENSLSIPFADALLNNCKKNELLKDLTISGDYEKIYFTACYSETIITNKYHSLHIELPNFLRSKDEYRIPFMQALEDTIKEIILIES